MSSSDSETETFYSSDDSFHVCDAYSNSDASEIEFRRPGSPSTQTRSREDSNPQVESHLPYWTPGSGYYGDTLGQYCREIATACTPQLLSWLDSIPVSPNGVFTIGDYATNDGFSTMPLFTSLIERLRKKHGEDLSIQVIYEDQEKNDFNSLFNRLTDDTSYLSRYSKVYPFATNLNFFKLCVPDGTCDLIFTNLAIMFLEKLPVTVKDGFLELFASAEEWEQFRLQAEQDWSKFLTLRAKELKAGGLLVIQTLCSRNENDGSEGRKRPTVCHIDIYNSLNSAWKQLKAEGKITQEEYERCTFKLYFRTAEDSKRPFEQEGSAVQVSGLRLMHYEENVHPCIFKAAYREQLRKGADPAESKKLFADTLVSAHRVWGQSTFQTSLSDMRTAAEKADLLDEVYKKFHTSVMSKDPESYRSDLLVARMMIRKL